ncbi:SHOCT domain-containing protein [Megasphaera sp.]
MWQGGCWPGNSSPGKEYRDFEQEMLRRYQPFFGDLYT